MINFEAELDRLAANLAVLDVMRRTGTRINCCLVALSAIRTLERVKLHAARSAEIPRGKAGIDYGLETVPHINAVSVAWLHFGPGLPFAGNGPFHRLYDPPNSAGSSMPATEITSAAYVR
jgi:hypothetical protein